MLKVNEERINDAIDNGFVGENLARVLQGEGSELEQRALNSTGAAPSWMDSVGDEYTVRGFDLVNSEVRVYKNVRKNEFERLSKDHEVFVADGVDANNKPLGEYVLRPISYVAAIVDGSRSSISIATLMSYTKNRKDFADDAKNKQNILSRTAPSPADYVLQNTDLIGATLKVVAAKKVGRFESNAVMFQIVPAK